MWVSLVPALYQKNRKPDWKGKERKGWSFWASSQGIEYSQAVDTLLPSLTHRVQVNSAAFVRAEAVASHSLMMGVKSHSAGVHNSTGCWEKLTKENEALGIISFKKNQNKTKKPNTAGSIRLKGRPNYIGMRTKQDTVKIWFFIMCHSEISYQASSKAYHDLCSIQENMQRKILYVKSFF